MTEQTTRASLFTKLAIISAAIPPIKPTGYNQDTKKAYADADDITAALKPLLGQHNIAIVMQINNAVREDTGQRTGSGSPYIRTSLDCTFIIADGETGETIVCPWSAEAADHMKDKGLPKALTIARRTFLIHTFGLMTGEERQLWEKEERAETSQPQRQAAAPAQPTNGSANPDKASEKQIKMLFAIWSKNGYEGRLQDWIQNTYKCAVDELTKKDASAAIELLDQAETPA